MRESKGTVNFILRKEKVNKDGKSVLMLSYSLKGERSRLSLERAYKKDLSIYPYLFDSKQNQAIYYPKKEAREVLKKYAPDFSFDYDSCFMLADEVRAFNFKLEEIISIVVKSEQYFQLSDLNYSSKDVIERVKLILAGDTKEINSIKKIYLVDYINDELSLSKSLGNYNTIKNKTTMFNHLVEYEKESKVKTELYLVGRKYLQTFYNWLLEKGQINTTAGTQISKLKSYLNQARKDGLEVDLTYKDFTVKSQEMEVITLDFREFDAVRTLDLSKQQYYSFNNSKGTNKVGYKTLQKVQDIFLFGCYTGLRFSDIMNLRSQNIKDGFISLSVIKTKQRLEIPLLKQAEDIIYKYKTDLSLLPRITNQRFNQYIKIVCKEANINEKVEIVRYQGANTIKEVYNKYELISAHTSRKTFITVSLELGMGTEEVMQISGHTSYKSFRRYVNITKERAKKVMENLWTNQN